MNVFKRTTSEIKTFLVAITEFHGTTSKEIHYAGKWDQLELLDDSDVNWYNVVNLRNNQNGLIPSEFCAFKGSLEAEDWYFGDICQRKAEELLLNPAEESGSFLVRPAVSETYKFILSVRYNSFVIHYKIRSACKGFQLSPLQSFKTLNEIINFYSMANENCSLRLRKPCFKPMPVINQVALNEKWIIPRNKYKAIEEHKIFLEKFCYVCKGRWNNQNVLIKVIQNDCKDNRQFQELLMSGKYLNDLNHPNLIRIYGVTLNGYANILMECLSVGTLHNFLKDSDYDTISHMERKFIISQIAKGMKYLEQREIAHLNLVSSNIYVGDNLLVKIGDMISPQKLINLKMYETNNVDLPFAPEAVNFIEFSSKSDVWSFGTLIHEVFNNCKINAINDIISKCHNMDPLNRPKFDFLSQFFDNIDITHELSRERPTTTTTTDHETIINKKLNDYLEK